MTTETFQKQMMADESDPQKLSERAADPQGSFLDVYRSLHTGYLPMDEFFVTKSIESGVVPDVIRYGVMERGPMRAFRGVVKSKTGSCFYFNWHEGTEFKMAKAATPEGEWEARRLLKSCQLGCDLRKAESAPIDAGQSIEEDVDEDNSRKGAVGFVPSTATAPVDEDRYLQSQQRLMTEQHPGSTQAQDPPPDDDEGKQWHEPLARAQDGLGPLASNDGQVHWRGAELLKAYGQYLQQTAPRVAADVTPVELRYMSDVLGISQTQIRKGLRMSPRQRIGFEDWKTAQLRDRLSHMKSWLGRR